MKQHICLVGSLILIACFVYPAGAVTLETVLQTSLERNPDIQEAKSGLEQAAGKRLVFRSVAWPDVELGVPAGVQMGHRAGESGVKGFAIVRGALTQTLFNASLPASLRRGDVEVLIAQQQLNVAVVEQLHAARLAFYAALYNRSLESIRREQQRRLDENVSHPKKSLRSRVSPIRAPLQARQFRRLSWTPKLKARIALIGTHNCNWPWQWRSIPQRHHCPSLKANCNLSRCPSMLIPKQRRLLQRRADLKLARLFVRAANEDQRIIAADYYPAVVGSIPGEYVPVTGIHREGSTSKTQDFIGSEIREKAAYTWRVIDNGKVGGAVLRARSAREINELTCRKLESEYPSRTFADRERSQDNRGSRKIARLRNGGRGGKRHARCSKIWPAVWRPHSNTGLLKISFWRPRADC